MYPIDFFYRAAQAYPDRIAVERGAVQVPYSELSRSVSALACALQNYDPTPGSRVGLCATNSVEYVVAMLAIMAAGKIWVPLNYRSTKPEINRILDAITATILLVDDAGEQLVEDGRGKKIHVSEFSDLIQQFKDDSPVRHVFTRDDTQAIKFTGGTTGAPKGVMQPYRAWVATIVNQIAGWQITADDKFVVGAPLSHGTGTYVMPMLAQGAALILTEAGDPDSLVRAFAEQGGSITFMPPTLVYKLMSVVEARSIRFPSLRLLIYGGAPMPAEKIAAAQQLFGPVVATTFGQTEAPQIVTLLKPDALVDERYRASVGRVTWFSEVRVMSPDGQEVAAGETGEVAVRGDLVMTGYWQRPDLTEQTLKNGWLYTGDVGYIDQHGFLFLKERLRDVIITGGFNVYPIDVEGTLSLHPAVHEAAVFGMPDDKWGESVNAAIELKRGYQVEAAELMAFVRERLGPVLTPKSIYFYESLPRSSVGKVLKTDIREKLAQTHPECTA